MSTNANKPHEQDFKTEALTTAENIDKSGRLNASTQNEVAVQGLITPGSVVTNPRYTNPDTLLENVANRYKN